MIRKAFRTTCCGLESIVSETTVARARAATFRSARDAGYRPKWLEVKARRAALPSLTTRREREGAGS